MERASFIESASPQLMHSPKAQFVGGPRLMEILIEMEVGGALGKKIDKHGRPTHTSLVSAVFLVDNPDIPGAIMKNAAN